MATTTTESSYTSELTPFNQFTITENHVPTPLYSSGTAPFTITANTFALDANGYIKFKLQIDPTDSYSFSDTSTATSGSVTFVSAEICEDEQTTYINLNTHTPVDFTTDFTNSSIPSLKSIGYKLHLKYALYESSGTLKGVYSVYHNFTIKIPELTLISPYSFEYESEVMLQATGTYTWDLTIQNPYGTAINGKFTDAEQNFLGSEATTITKNTTFDADDVGTKTLQIYIRSMWNVGGSATEIAAGTNWNLCSRYFYWYDNDNEDETKRTYHAVYNKNNPSSSSQMSTSDIIIQNDTIEISIKINDNDQILTLVSASVEPGNPANDTVKNVYIQNKNTIKLSLTINYTGNKGNILEIKLYNSKRSGGAQFIYLKKTLSKAAGEVSISGSSATLTSAGLVNLKLEITDSHNRRIEKDFGEVQIHEYSQPKIKTFDAFYSNAAGALDLQSEHITAQTSFSYSNVNGLVTLTQNLTANNASIVPDFTSGQLKYLNSVTLPLGTESYDIVFTITDSLGGSDSVTFSLSRKGGVLLDFNNTGYGMAIGKLSETHGFEVNIPAIFFNKVEYADGTRQTTDAATNLGFMDTYNTGCRTIQEALDYIIAKLV